MSFAVVGLSSGSAAILGLLGFYLVILWAVHHG